MLNISEPNLRGGEAVGKLLRDIPFLSSPHHSLSNSYNYYEYIIMIN